MKIPSTIRVAGIDYKIVNEQRIIVGGKHCRGSADFNKAEIALDDTVVCHEVMCVTLWHELCHVLIQNAGLTLDDEESVCDVFSQGVYQILQDNGRKLFDTKE